MKTQMNASKHGISENTQLIRLMLELETELMRYQKRNGYYRQDTEVRTLILHMEILLEKIMYDQKNDLSR